MNSRSERLTELFHLHISGKITEFEQAELWDYVDDPLYAGQLDLLLAQSFNEQTNDYSLRNSQSAYVLEQIFASENLVAAPTKKIRLWPKLAIAVAAAAMILSLGILLFKAYEGNRLQQSALANINPGKMGATLTLANGKKIKINELKDGELAKEAGLVITKNGKGQLLYTASNTGLQEGSMEKASYNTLTTAKGETFSVVLPDGSMVQLNAASSITYPTSLAKDNVRNVKLQGEGYFEIAKHYRGDQAGISQNIPFIVISGRQKVQVLGTHFNINSYPEEATIKTTLLEGAVRVTVAGPGSVSKSVALKPNQQSSLSLRNNLLVSEVNVENAIAWKKGMFYFADANVADILREFARWYNLEVEYTGKIPNRYFTGEIYRNLSFTEALKILDFANVHFKIDGRKIIVSP